MKITPKITGGQPIGARIDLYIEDAPHLALILTYARYALPGPQVQKMLQRLAAVCEAINRDAETHIDVGPDYHKTRAAFDPAYKT